MTSDTAQHCYVYITLPIRAIVHILHQVGRLLQRCTEDLRLHARCKRCGDGCQIRAQPSTATISIFGATARTSF